MNNKGFTLIELIAILLVLVAIFLISFPSLTNMSRLQEEEKYNNMVEDLCTAGKSYMYANMDAYPNLSIVASEIEIRISELIDYGNVDESLINPKTKSSIKEDTLKYIILDDLSLDCEYIEE